MIYYLFIYLHFYSFYSAIIIFQRLGLDEMEKFVQGINIEAEVLFIYAFIFHKHLKFLVAKLYWTGENNYVVTIKRYVNSISFKK